MPPICYANLGSEYWTSGFTYLTKLDIANNKQSISMHLYITFIDIFLFYAELFR